MFFSITTRLTIAHSQFLLHLYLLRNEKIAKGNPFEADFRHEEVANMKGESVLCVLNYFIILCFLHYL